MSTAESALPRQQAQNLPSDDVYDDGYLRVEHKNYYLACDGRPIYLPRTEFLLISCLVRSVNRVVAAEELWRCARDVDKPFNAESLHVFMYRLRRKLLPHNVRIDTVVNVGYRLVVSATDGNGSPS
ncbi:MAG TPA: winged helix-turn-helix domain-containing protein [Pyrinomonadaceae bacterium]|jgi:DNA-binding response OmpR family regulator|nr:winged helix-turn-helix domain-containing protein [Pyrinomonadaceae bacterium]